jgi:hypothetical protein
MLPNVLHYANCYLKGHGFCVHGFFLIHTNMLNYAFLLKGITENLDTNDFPYMKFHTNIRKMNTEYTKVNILT